MKRNLLILALALAILFAGCCMTPPAPEPTPTPTATPTPAPRCGDGSCNGNEQATGNCCTDCGCPANYTCDNSTNTCHPSPRFLRDIAAESYTADVAYTQEESMTMTLITRVGGSEVTNVTHTTTHREADLGHQELYYRSESGRDVSEKYALGNITYLKLSDIGWVKDDTPATFWEESADTMRLDKKLISRADAAYIGTGNIGGTRCHWISLTLSSESMDDLKRMLSDTLEAFEGLNYTMEMKDYAICVDEQARHMLAANMSVEFNMSAENASATVIASDYSTYDYSEVIIVVPSSVRSAPPIPTEYKVQRGYCTMIDPSLPTVRAAATSAVKPGHEGDLSMDQVMDQYDYVKQNIRYIRDPSRPELETYPYSPDVTLANRAGDCDDQATLLASLVEAIGGSARVRVSFDCGHAYTEVYIGSSESSVTFASDALHARYPGVSMLYSTDSDGTKWVVLDPAGASAPGELHPSCYSDLGATWAAVGTPYEVYSCK